MAASQHVVDRAQKDKLDKRKKLLALYKWAHYDCVQHPESFEEDEMVAALVRQSRSSVHANGGEKNRDEWSTSMADRADDLFLGSDDSGRDEDDMGDHHMDGGEGFKLDSMQTGRILFVFAKNSDKTTDKLESSDTTPPALD